MTIPIDEIEFGDQDNTMTLADLETLDDYQAAMDILDVALATMENQIECYKLDEEGRGNRGTDWYIQVRHAHRLQKLVRVRVQVRMAALQRMERSESLLAFLEREMGKEFDALADKWERCA